MGKFVEVIILVSTDIRVFLTETQLFWVKIYFGMDGAIREAGARVKQEVMDSEVANFI